MLRKHLAAVLAVGVLLLAGCSASRPTAGSSSSMPMASASVTAPAAPVSGNQVNIDGFAFVPATLNTNCAHGFTTRLRIPIRTWRCGRAWTS